MIIISLDLSPKTCGIATNTGLLKTLYSSTILDMLVSVISLINLIKPNLVLLESIYLGPNAEVFKNLAKLHGVIEYVCYANNIDCIVVPRKSTLAFMKDKEIEGNTEHEIDAKAQLLYWENKEKTNE